ncbi:MAG: response regulator [Candidatus Omnitrophota bacterium]
MSKILLVDDESDIVDLLKFRLEAYKYDISVAVNGNECLAKVNTERPDLILLDLVMPEMDGYETIRRLKELPETRDIPVILFTASYTTDIEIKSKELGAFDYIVKPFEPADLIKKIEAALKSNYK